ncbi:MAG TPA: hypothetical protein DEO88_09860 [Syntrophobacteraceae bacterium]|nr:hypothetical protein [Syntrophobacteraceae bacterium]
MPAKPGSEPVSQSHHWATSWLAGISACLVTILAITNADTANFDAGSHPRFHRDKPPLPPDSL